MVADTVRDGIRGLFEGLVPAEVVEAYDRLLASDGCAKEQAEALVGDPGLVATLTEWGMAHVQPLARGIRRGCVRLHLTLRCRGFSLVIRPGLSVTRRCCWMAIGGWPTLRRGSA